MFIKAKSFDIYLKYWILLKFGGSNYNISSADFCVSFCSGGWADSPVVPGVSLPELTLTLPLVGSKVNSALFYLIFIHDFIAKCKKFTVHIFVCCIMDNSFRGTRRTMYNVRRALYDVCRTLMYAVHCTIYAVHCTMYAVHCTMYAVHCTMYAVHCTMYAVHYTMYAVHCTMYAVHRTLYNVRRTPYNVQHHISRSTSIYK